MYMCVRGIDFAAVFMIIFWKYSNGVVGFYLYFIILVYIVFIFCFLFTEQPLLEHTEHYKERKDQR